MCSHVIVCMIACAITYVWSYFVNSTITVQLNSNLTLVLLSLAKTQLVFKYACELVASARMCL